MSVLGAILTIIAAWAFAWPKSAGKWCAELVKAYRAAMGQEGTP